MNSSESGSSQHILITYAEYERLKNIEKQFEKLQGSLHKKLQIPSKHNKAISFVNPIQSNRNKVKIYNTKNNKIYNLFFSVQRQWRN